MPGVGTTHHVKIGTNFFNIMPGTYRKRQAPAFGARFATGDPDYSNLTFWQHWVQSCWVGGFGAETWMDDAMYDQAAGVDGSQHEVLVLSRDLGPIGATRTSGNWALGGTVFEREFVEFQSKLYCLVRAGAGTAALWLYNEATDAWVLKNTFGGSIRGMCVFSGKLWLGDSGTTLNFMNPDETFGTIAKPAGRTEIPFAMRVFRGHMYVGFGRFIWRLKSNETWDGTTAFFEAVGVDLIETMEPHLGFLYMGSRNGHILRTDANATFDLWQFDPGSVVTAMRSYDGRLFVLTSEGEVGTTAQSGVLYQFTGSAVTELKRWGLIGRITTTRRLRTIFRRLFFGASNLLGNGAGFGIAQYDALEDAYQIFATNRDGVTYPPGTDGVNHVVDDVVYWKGYIFASVRGTGVWKSKLTFKDVSRLAAAYDTTAAGGGVGSLNGGWIQSSDFDGGTPGLLKYFRQIVIHADLLDASCSVFVEHSVDGGQTWVEDGSLTKTSSAVRYRKAFAIMVRSSRLKYRLTLRTTNTGFSPMLRGVVVSYLPIPDPTWQWDMTLVLASSLELLDGTVDEAVDPAVQATYLDGLVRLGLPVTFQDVDGTVWDAATTGGVLIQDYQKDVSFLDKAGNGPIESFVRISFLEAAEGYVGLS